MKRIGECKRCGDCCDGKVVLRSLVPHLPIHLRVMLKVALRFKKDLKCPFLNMGNEVAACAQYHDRFDFCREFPAEPADLILDRCGFTFEASKETI